MNDQLQSHQVRCSGLVVQYEDHGAGAPVVLLHGGLVTGHLMWSNHVPALARNHRVLVPDSRGHGRTDNPEGRLGYDLMADDCAAFMEALGLDRPVVVGYSDGAQTALELGIRHPDRVAGLVLGGVVAEPTAQYVQALGAIGFIEPGVVDLERFEQVLPGFLDVIKDLHRHVYGPEYWRRLLRLTSQLWLTLPSYSDDTLAGIPVPTLVLTGDRDEEPLAQAPRLCRTIPGAELAVIPAADHAAVERSLFREVPGGRPRLPGPPPPGQWNGQPPARRDRVRCRHVAVASASAAGRRGVCGVGAAAADVAAPDPAERLRPELALQLHEAPHLGAVHPEVRLDAGGRPADDGQVDVEQLRAPLQRRRDRPVEGGVVSFPGSHDP